MDWYSICTLQFILKLKLSFSELQRRREFQDNSGIIFFSFQQKNLVTPSLDPSCLGRSNEGSQPVFSWRDNENDPQIILVTPSYLEHSGKVIIFKHL